MITEKTAQKREAAVLQATKPQFEKIGNGLEYLRYQMEEQQRKVRKWQETISQQYENERGITTTILNDQDKFEQQLNIESAERKADSHTASKRTDDILRNMFVKCQACGMFMSPTQIVCHRCGEISSVFPYDFEEGSEVVIKDCVTEINNLSHSIKSAKQRSSKASYQETQKQIDSMSKVSSIAKEFLDNHQTGSKHDLFKHIKNEADIFLENCCDKRIEVAVVGNVKAGKSSLINALIGARMASVDATPETSVLVKYRTTDAKNFIKVSFYSEQQWNALWQTVQSGTFRKKYDELKADDLRQQYLNKPQEYTEYSTPESLQSAIMEWTNSNSPKHFFVSEVEVGYYGDAFPNDVVLVDTPGLQDPVQYRSDITRNYIQNADWVLACISSENLSSKDEAEFLNRVLGNLNHDARRMIIVATKTDMLIPGDYEKKRIDFISNIATSFYNGKEGVVTDHYVSVAAEIHTLLNEYLHGSINNDSKKKLHKALINYDLELSDIADHQEEIIAHAGVNKLYNQLDRKVLKNRRRNIIKKIDEEYERAITNIRSYTSTMLADAEESIVVMKEESIEYFGDIDELNYDINIKKKELDQLTNLLRETMKKLQETNDNRSKGE